MSENRRSEGLNSPSTTTNPTGTSGTGAGSAGNTGTAFKTGTGTGTGAATGTALSQTAQEYGQKISEAASQAKEFVTDKVSVVGDKLKEIQNADLAEVAQNAKDYARKNPGQAILISAAAGFLLGLVLRGSRRS